MEIVPDLGMVRSTVNQTVNHFQAILSPFHQRTFIPADTRM